MEFVLHSINSSNSSNTSSDNIYDNYIAYTDSSSIDNQCKSIEKKEMKMEYRIEEEVKEMKQLQSNDDKTSERDDSADTMDDRNKKDNVMHEKALDLDAAKIEETNRIYEQNDTATSTEIDSVKRETNNVKVLMINIENRGLEGDDIKRDIVKNVVHDEESDLSEQSSDYDTKGNKKRRRKDKPCIFDKCKNRARGKDGLCIRHGGGPRCTYEGCRSSARDSSQLCMHHGGGARCSHESGCTKGAVGGSFCIRHGGGKRCLFDGCDKSSFRQFSYCSRHLKVIKLSKASNNGSKKAVVNNKGENMFCMKTNEWEMDTKALNTESTADNHNTKPKRSSKAHVTTNSHYISLDHGDKIDTILENKSGNNSIVKEILMKPQIKPSKELIKYNNSPPVVILDPLGVSQLFPHSGFDPRMDVQSFNAAIMPMQMHQAVGMSYSPYPVYSLSGMSYASLIQPAVAPGIIANPNNSHGLRSTQEHYRPPYYYQHIP